MSLSLLLLEALGGLGLLLLGMRVMSGGIQRLAGGGFRNFLEKATANRFASVGTGGMLSAMLQSSTAASVLAVGLVNSGLLSLYAALGVLLGTGVGTTVAIRIFSFKISILALPFIFIGVFLKFFGSRRRSVNIGDVLLGVGLLLLGMRIMEANLAPLKEMVVWLGLQLHFSSWPVAAVILGAMLSFFAQSGFTALAIIIAMSDGGLLPIQAGIAMAIGETIGTACITGIAAIGGTPDAKKSALFFILMNVAAATLAMIFFPLFFRLVTASSPEATGAVVVNAHTLFVAVTILLFLPFLGLIVRAVRSHRDLDVEPRTQHLDLRVINTPPIALSLAKKETKRMARIGKMMYDGVISQFYDYNAGRTQEIMQREETLDVLQRELAGFLVILSRRPLPAEVSAQIPYMINIINDLERFGDYAESVLEYLRRKKEEHIFFSDAAMNELKIMAGEVAGIISLFDSTFENATGDELQKAAMIRENVILLHQNMKNNHINRLRTGNCTIMAGLLYSDMMITFQKIAECSYHIVEAAQELR